MDKLIHFLYNQQEIISSVAEITEHTYTLKKPRLLQMVMTAPGEASITMVPWFIGNPDGLIKIDKSMIGPISESVSKKLEDGYLQQTTSIQLVK